jgi:2'-5' RNA ligase
MRLFTGLSLSPPVSDALAAIQTELRPLAPLRWSPVANFHITLRFLGAWPSERLAELQDALAQVPTPAPFPVTVAGFGFLPDARRPKIFFAGVQSEPGLHHLFASLEPALNSLGLPPEPRPWLPHATLARIAGQDLTSLRERLAAAPDSPFGTFPVSEFHLYSSHPNPSHPHSDYSIVGTYPLTTDKS